MRVRWDRTTLPLRPRLHYIKHTADWLYCSGCWFHLGSAYLHISSKHFAFNTIILFMKKQLIWVFEWRKSVHYWWSYILFSPECKELTSMLDPLLYRWGVPPVVIRCVHWTMQMWVLQTWIKAQDIVIVMPNCYWIPFFKLPESSSPTFIPSGSLHGFTGTGCTSELRSFPPLLLLSDLCRVSTTGVAAPCRSKWVLSPKIDALLRKWKRPFVLRIRHKVGLNILKLISPKTESKSHINHFTQLFSHQHFQTNLKHDISWPLPSLTAAAPCVQTVSPSFEKLTLFKSKTLTTLVTAVDFCPRCCFSFDKIKRQYHVCIFHEDQNTRHLLWIYIFSSCIFKIS